MSASCRYHCSIANGYLHDLDRGPRRVGKTTLVHAVAEETGRYLYLNCDEPDVRTLLTRPNSAALRNIIGDYETVVIDEAQRVSDIGITLKLIVDGKLTKNLLATGSSSFDLANRISEPLTGRKKTFSLFPLLYDERMSGINALERTRLIPECAVFGMYPQVVNASGADNKRAILREIIEGALYRDLLEFQRIRNPQKLHDLLRALAHRTGSEISYHELGQSLELTNPTIESYVNLLEQSFILFRQPALVRNRSKEISRMRKIFFTDVGIRNALIGRFDDYAVRPDRGELWESWALLERVKLQRSLGSGETHRFWRLKSGAEVDLVEEQGDSLKDFEFKAHPSKRQFPKSWGTLYPSATCQVITPDSVDAFLTPAK